MNASGSQEQRCIGKGRYEFSLRCYWDTEMEIPRRWFEIQDCKDCCLSEVQTGGIDFRKMGL